MNLGHTCVFNADAKLVFAGFDHGTLGTTAPGNAAKMFPDFHGLIFSDR